MKNAIRLPGLAAALAALLAFAPLASADDLNFMLSNETSSELTGFYVSHSGTDQWEENLLDDAYLAPGYEIGVVIADGRSTCVYDISGEFADGSEVEDYELDLCELGEYTFYEE